MKICPKCLDDHAKPGTFCSRICANSHTQSTESNAKRAASNKGKYNVWSSANPERIKELATKISKTKQAKYAATPFEELGSTNRRRRVFEEQNKACNRCKRTEWEGFSIPLELEHKDGNTDHNERENLEGLCPNCHALTPTWRGRNR